ncbi:DUF2075 domain-containing protein [Micromonospora sp. NPDC049274]|uniref:DUF2075 domain-containing protein n=1 Tax=Micromonospora sp. NPDC049274 TaxID=3154829 RepID=UPI0034182340
MPAGEVLLPDAHSFSQAAVESAVMNQLLLASRLLSADVAGQCLPLPVQAVRPLSSALHVTVPVNAVEQFAAMLCAPGMTTGGGEGEAFMVTSARNVVTLTLPNQADAQVQLRCSWDRLNEALRTTPGVEVLSSGRLRIRGGVQRTPSRPEHRGALSACLRRIILFSDARALSWLVAWNEWVASGRRRDRPEPPDEVLVALTKSRFGLANAAASTLLLGGLQEGSGGALPRRPSGLGGGASATMNRAGDSLPVSPDLALADVTFTLTVSELQQLIAKNALPEAVTGPPHPDSDPVLAAKIRSAMRRSASLVDDLVVGGLGAVSMIMGFQLPLTTRRVDLVLAGEHPETGDDSYVVVELKAWTHAESSPGSDSLVTVGGVKAPRLHPGVQVDAYCEYLNDVLGAFENGHRSIRGAAYLYGALDKDVSELLTRRDAGQGSVFTSQRSRQFLNYLRANLAPASGAGAADRLLTSAVRPSRNLLEFAGRELQERSHFRLLDEQRLAYELVLRAVDRSRTANHKTVVVVSGGTSTGKSAIGLSLLGELARRGLSVMHATGARPFTETLRRDVAKGDLRVQSLFRYFSSFTDAQRDELDVLVCDEAHGIRAISLNREAAQIGRGRARPQIDELIEAARVPVFLLDEDLVGRPGGPGSLPLITHHAGQRGLEIEFVFLNDQFRYSGSSAYEQWTKALLGIDDGTPMNWVGDGRFDLRMADSPEEMEAMLADKHAAGESAGISAGYCWPWSDPQPDGSLVPDVQIGGWARPWIVKSERSVAGAPGSAFWATDPNGFGQIGSVYTVQGFDYDWSGVIIGPDLVARDGRLVTRRSESKDPLFLAGRAVGDEAADRFIRNTYRVLMSRGMRGVILYSADPETQAYLASRM